MPKAENLEKLIERKAKLDAKIQAIRSREAAKAKKDDTRRKILVGSLVLEAVQKNHDVKAWLDTLLGKKLTRADDRALFNLSPKVENDSQAPTPEKAPEISAQAGPVRYPVCVYQDGSSFGAWMPDFPSLGVSARNKEDALGNAIDAVHDAIGNGQKRPASDEKTARQQFTIYAGSKLGGNTPEYSIEWVAVE